MSIMQFCVRKPTTATQMKIKNCDVVENFKPFAPKKDMKLAPVFRSTPLTKEQIEQFDILLGETEKNSDNQRMYLDELRSGVVQSRSSEPTSFAETDVTIIESPDEQESIPYRRKHRKKLLQFCENRRPSKYGYWTRKSKRISGRKPFAKDEAVFNYEIDSDEEWEEEEGDDCRSDEEDEEEENENDADDDEDKRFFVDHGYLSSSEGASEEEDGDPESRRERGKAKMMTFEAEMESRKKKRLRLIAIGPVWQGSCQNGDTWSHKMAELKAMILSPARPVPTSFTPDVLKTTTPARSMRKTPGSERKSVKRKNQEVREKRAKRGALSLP